MAAALGAFLGQVLRSEQLARVFLRRADVHERRLAQLVQHLFAVSADLLVRRSLEVIARRGIGGGVGRVRPAFLLPFDAPAIDQLNLVVPVVLQRPVGVSGKPIVVVAVENDRGFRRDAAAAEDVGERLFRRDVPCQLILEVALPVPADCALDVAFLIDARVDVDLDQAKA